MIMSERFSYPAQYYEKCRELLEFALKKVPLYRGWAKFDPGPGATLDERFDALPHLDKAAMRRSFPRGLMPEGMDLGQGLSSGEIEYTFTSGTTSEKVTNIWNQDWWSRSEAASWQLSGALRGLRYPQRQAKLASSLNVGISCEEDLPMSHRILGDTLYLNEKTSVLQWQPRHYERMAKELNEYRPAVLEANPSLLARLCWWALDCGAEIAPPKVIVFTYEFPSAIHLSAIRQVFSSPFVRSYGSTETGFVLEQCSDGLMHQNTDFCRIDFIPLARRFGDPDLGSIVVSTFGNPWNCIVRFEVGDLVRLHRDGNCGCGLTQGLTADCIEGRTANLTFTPEGDIVTTKKLDDSLAAAGVLRDYVLRQTDRKHYRIEAVTPPQKNKKIAREAIYNALQNVYGNGGIFDIVFRDCLLPGPAGKFRRTQADFSFDERGLFA
jgi:phenylacetate-CoA ligase